MTVASDAPPLRIFINYRHADTAWVAWALYFKLELCFGAENVFFDNGTLRGGMQWFEEIKAGVAGAGAFLALIGPSWMSKLIGHLHSGDRDFAAKEIDLALRAGSRLTVVPVLVDDAPPPDPAELPPSLKALPGRHAERLRQTHARDDIEHLIARLTELRDKCGSEG